MVETQTVTPDSRTRDPLAGFDLDSLLSGGARMRPQRIALSDGALDAPCAPVSTSPFCRMAATRTRLPRQRRQLAQRYLTGLGIEIGAMHNPLKLPRSVKVEYLDVTTREENIRKFPEL